MKKADGIPVHCEHTKIVDIGDVRANLRNPNKHSIEQVQQLAHAISMNGWRSPIIISKRSGLVTRGHGRLEAAWFLKKRKVPIDIQVYESEAAEYADMIADNFLASLSEMSMGLTKDIIQEFDDGDFDLKRFGYSEKELEKMMTAAPPEGEGVQKDSDEGSNPDMAYFKVSCSKMDAERMLTVLRDAVDPFLGGQATRIDVKKEKLT